MPDLVSIQRKERLTDRTERRSANRALLDAVRFSPPAFKLAIARRAWDELQDMIVEGVQKRDPWAGNAALQVLGLIGPQQLVQVNLFAKLGVAGEEELQRLLELGRQQERNQLDATRTVEDYAQDARELLCAALPKMDDSFQQETVEMVHRATGHGSVIIEDA
jgi:hypothetical protein